MSNTDLNTQAFAFYHFPLYHVQVMDLQLGASGVEKDYVTAKDTYCASWNVDDLESGISKT